MGYYDQDNLPVTISTLIEKKMNDQDVRPEQAILQHKEGIDLIPSNLNLSLTEVNMFNAMSIEERKKEIQKQNDDATITNSMLMW